MYMYIRASRQIDTVSNVARCILIIPRSRAVLGARSPIQLIYSSNRASLKTHGSYVHILLFNKVFCPQTPGVTAAQKKETVRKWEGEEKSQAPLSATLRTRFNCHDRRGEQTVLARRYATNKSFLKVERARTLYFYTTNYYVAATK